MAYKSKKKEVTLAEFQAWLEGVEELQPKDWSPDATQWKLIRNKIKNIVVSEVAVAAASAEPPMIFPGARRPVAAEEGGIPGVPLAPEVPGSVPADLEVTPPSEEAAHLLQPGADGKHKTPNIEPGPDGKVESSFA